MDNGWALPSVWYRLKPDSALEDPDDKVRGSQRRGNEEMEQDNIMVTEPRDPALRLRVQRSIAI